MIIVSYLLISKHVNLNNVFEYYYRILTSNKLLLLYKFLLPIMFAIK